MVLVVVAVLAIAADRVEIFDAVERFYRQYYFRPSYIFKSVKKMVKSRDERKRLLREAGEFFSTMKKRRDTGAAA